MASLKEIKGRIGSVKSTQKITSAMKMISSAKLRKAQQQVENFLPYKQRLTKILDDFLSAETTYFTPLSENRDLQKVTLLVVTSNSSLCGAFNSNIINLFTYIYKEYLTQGVEIEVYAIGKKIDEHIKRHLPEVELKNGLNHIIDKPEFEHAKTMVDSLINQFLTGKTDKIHFLYNHFKTTSTQIPTDNIFLPISLNKETDGKGCNIDYLVEPSKSELLDTLIPKSLRIDLYSALLDSAAAEQAARMVAMQVATDNADDLLNELSIQYNKQRQQAITSELLDIVGGSESLK